MATKAEVAAALAKLEATIAAAEQQFASVDEERARLAADLVELRKLIDRERARSGLQKLNCDGGNK
jgi:septal ring factor EnvC (AmiA/AmiB activator)